MKILAGAQLSRRNPRQAPASAKAKSASGYAPASANQAPMTPAATTASTEASPSMPSMKLYRFTSHTIHRTVNA